MPYDSKATFEARLTEVRTQITNCRKFQASGMGEQNITMARLVEEIKTLEQLLTWVIDKFGPLLDLVILSVAMRVYHRYLKEGKVTSALISLGMLFVVVIQMRRSVLIWGNSS